MLQPRSLAGWKDDARKAITENPDYFVWWYTTKSMALVAALGLAIYYGTKYHTLRGRK